MSEKMEPMDPDELARRAIDITGSTAWKIKLARKLGRSRSSIFDWINNGLVPAWLKHALTGLEVAAAAERRANDDEKNVS